MELVPEEEMETSKQGGPNTFADRRAKKIARFKRQGAAESKLLELKERKDRRGRSTKASALSTPVESGEDDVLDNDGEEEREGPLAAPVLQHLTKDDLSEMYFGEFRILDINGPPCFLTGTGMG